MTARQCARRVEEVAVECTEASKRQPKVAAGVAARRLRKTRNCAPEGIIPRIADDSAGTTVFVTRARTAARGRKGDYDSEYIISQNNVKKR